MNATTGNYTSLTGVTTTGTTANFVTVNGASGVFTTLVSGGTITGQAGQFSDITGVRAGFGTVTGATVTGTTANFVTVSGTTVTGTTANFTSGVFSTGSATSPSVAVGTGTSNRPGIYSPGADQLAISTSGTGRIIVDASGNVNIDSNTLYVDAVNNRVGIGTTNPGAQLEINGGVSRTDYWTPAGKYSAKLGLVTATNTDVYAGITGSYQNGTSANLILQARFSDVGTTNGVALKNSSSNAGGLAICSLTATSGGAVETERARIDSSGRLLVGTSSARSLGGGLTSAVQIESATDFNKAAFSIINNSNDSAGSYLVLGKSRAGALNGNTIVQNNDLYGDIRFAGADGTDLETISARIAAEVDGTPGTNDMPGRLVFGTTADGASSPTERLRITSAGVLQVADAGNITVGTTTGTKIGTATTQKIGFYNATPVVQPTAVANATTSVDVITQLNDLLAKLRTLGIIAT